MDVVDKIRMAETGQKGPYGDVPIKAIVIKQATLEK
jgi:peptidyl-prolyl cis-trans isomerase A (cyclophilin A)